GTPGFSGDDGPAASAQLADPTGVAVDGAGNLYIADAGNNRIRKVSGGVITTIAGNGSQGFRGDDGPAVAAFLDMPWGIAVDASGIVHFSDSGSSRVRMLVPSAASTCTYALGTVVSAIPLQGGSLTVPVQTLDGCAWAVEGLPYWMTLVGAD